MSRKALIAPSSPPLPSSVIEELGILDRAALRLKWAHVFGTRAPECLSVELLRNAIAWKMQVIEHGDISPAARRDLQVIAQRHQSGRRAGTAKPPVPLPSAVLKPGTRLVKIWRGDTYTVDVEEEGVRWNGTLYGSLSAVAKAITGTHWNGLLFFGLRERKPAAGKQASHQGARRRRVPSEQVRGHG